MVQYTIICNAVDELRLVTYFSWFLLQNDNINIYIFCCRVRYLYIQACLIFCLICPQFVQHFVSFVHKTAVLDKKMPKGQEK
jgi:hypothetical protein